MNEQLQPDTTPTRATLRSYLQVLRRQWWVPLLVTLVALTAAITYTQRATPEYSSSMKIVVGQGRSLFGADVSGAFGPFTQTMTDLLRSEVVARRTIEERGLSETPKQLLDRLSVTTNPDTSVLQVRLRDTDRREGTETLATIGDIFVSLIDENLSDLGTREQPSTAPPLGATGTTGPLDDATRQAQADAVSATVFDPAHADPGQVSPAVKRTIALALALGLVGGILLAFLRDALSTGIRGEDEAAEDFGAPVLASLPTGVLGTKPHDVRYLPAKMSDRVSESVRLLAASLRFSAGQDDRGVVVVTSARPEDGKTSVVAHLAAALADTGSWVVAVEGDMHKPALHKMLDVDAGHAGLRDVLSGRVGVDDALLVISERTREPVIVAAGGGGGSRQARRREARFELLPAGPRLERPAEVLSLGSTGALLSRLRKFAEWVVVDTPPVLLSGDAFPFLQLADHVIVVCREGQTTRDEAQAVRSRMASLGIRDYHVVVTNSSEAGHRTYGYSAD